MRMRLAYYIKSFMNNHKRIVREFEKEFKDFFDDKRLYSSEII